VRVPAADDAHVTRTVTGVLLACTAILAACGTTEADVSACETAAEISPIGDTETWAPTPAMSILELLSGLTPNNDRLVRAIHQARDDAQSIVDASSPVRYPKMEAGVAALRGSLTGINDICGDLGL
jgi:hypothetical protein